MRKSFHVVAIVAKYFVLLFYLATPAASAENTVLRVALDDACPYTSVNRPYKGIFIDVLEAALIPNGYTLEYVNLPWKRAIGEIRTGDIDILTSASPIVFSKFLYNQERVMAESVCIYGRNSLGLNYQGVPSLKGYKIGWLEYQHKMVEGAPLYEFQHYQSQLDTIVLQPTVKNAPKRIIQMLISGRVDIVLFNQAMMKFYQSDPMYFSSLENIKRYHCFKPAMSLHFVFSDSSERFQKIASLLDDQLLQMKASGSYQQLLNKYFVRR